MHIFENTDLFYNALEKIHDQACNDKIRRRGPYSTSSKWPFEPVFLILCWVL